MSEPAPLTGEADPFDYAAYIVYVKRRGTEVNNRIKALCNDYSELVLQHVEDIAPADRPSWLQGVPTVVNMKTMAVITGTEALNQVEKWAAARPKAVGLAPPPGTTGVPLADSFSESLSADNAPDGDDANRPVLSLEDLLRRRGEKTVSQPAPPP